MSEDVFSLTGRSIEGKYDIERVVARGGFGVVYRATHRALRKPIAVKVLLVPPDLSDAMRRAFLDSFAREAQTVARLEHPAVVRVLDYGVSPMPSGETAPWMVLDWVTGRTLEDHLDERRGGGGATPAATLSLLRPVLEALADAHDQGIVHRDVKPANVMLVARGDTGPRSRGEPTARVLDFGIAKSVAGEEGAPSGMTHTRAAMLSFSLPYAAPEQVTGMRTGPWTDVHALALIVTQMITDCAPYPGLDAMEVQLGVLSPLRPTPARFGFDAGAWEPVLARALSLKPADRFPHAGALLAALESSVPESVTRVAAPQDASGSLPHTTAPMGAAPVKTATLSPMQLGAKVPTTTASRPVVVGGALGLGLSVLVGVGALVGYRALGDHAAHTPAATSRAPTPVVSSPRAMEAPPPPAPAPSAAPVVPAAPTVPATSVAPRVDAGVAVVAAPAARREPVRRRVREPVPGQIGAAPMLVAPQPALGDERLPTE